jgi:hypothetical protein
MRNNHIVEKNLSISSSINALGLPVRERSRALSALAKADALVGAFFKVAALLNRDQRRPLARLDPKSQ